MKKKTEMTERQYQAFIRKISTRLTEMEAEARSRGFAALEECDVCQHLQAVLFALDTAIRRRDWSCVGYGMVMAVQVLNRLEQPPDDFSLTPNEQRFIEALFARLTQPLQGERGH